MVSSSHKISRVVFRLLAAALFVLSPVSALAQQTAARPDRGFLPGASYSISDFENISLTNGNVNLSIPLASLPPIAGGKLKFALSAVYNSKLWNVTRTENQLGLFNNCATWVVDNPQLSERGGWVISGGYGIQIREAIEDFDYAVPDPLPDSCEQDSSEINQLRNYNWYRIVLFTPDGAEHELRPVDNSNTYQGSRGYLYGYYRDTPQTLNQPMRYYTYDGTFISVVLNPSGYSNYFTATLPDGTKVVQSNDGQRITDTNGNSIKMFGDTNGVTHFQDEQTGREIKYSYNPEGNNNQGQGIVEYQTVGGLWQTVTINFGTTQVQGKLYKINDWDIEGGELGTGAPCPYYGDFGASVPVIREIIYPATEPNVDPPQFTFEYNSDSTTQNVSDTVVWSCGATSQNYTRTVSNGMGEMSRVVTPSGATVDYTYSGDETHNFYPLGGNDDIARGIITEKEVTHDGVSETWTYQIYAFNACGGTVTGPDGSVTTESCYPKDPAYGTPYATGEFSGLTVTSIHSGKERIDRHWTSMVFSGGYTHATGSLSLGNFNPVVDAEYLSLLDGSGNRIKMSAKTFQYDYNGNVVETKEYDWFDPGSVTLDGNGVPTGVPAGATVLRTTNNTFHNAATSSNSANVYAKRSLSSGTPLILNALQQSTTGPAIAQLSYDGNSYGTAPTVGNVTSKSVWFDLESRWITTSSTYGLYGNIATTTDARGKVTQFFYDDATHALPNRVVVDPQNGTGTQTITTAFDYYTGLVTSQTDANGQVSTIDYTNQLLGTVDPFGRPGVTIGPDIGSGVNHRTRTIYEDNARTVTVLSDLNSEGDGLLKSQVISDMLGRTIESRQYENANDFIAVRKTYDIPNRLSKTSNPFRAGETVVWTTALTDVLGRTVSVTTPDNAVVATAYDANLTTVTDQAGKVRRRMVDALGRLLRVDEPDGSGNLGSTSSPNQPTSYDYDVFGNLLHVYQGSQTRTFTYDSLSRLRTAANPESGTISYNYDDNGNLTQKIDARSITSAYVYDSLNRVTTRDYSDSTPDVSYVYDSAGVSHSKGRLTSVSSSVSTYSYSGYDAAGKVLGGSQIIGAQTYTMSYGYNLAGHVTSMTYPSGRTVTNSYDNAGRLSSFAGNLGGTQRTYSTGISYSSFGGMKWEQYGTTTPLYHKTFYNIRGQMFDTRVSSVNDTWDWNRGRLILYYSSNHQWGGSGTDNNGNVRFMEHWIPPPNATLDQAQYLIEDSYTYDALSRLSAVNEQTLDIGGGGSWTPRFAQAYSYDRWGNRTINAGATWGTGINNKQFTVDTNNNRLGVPGGQTGTMSYDNAGNLTTDTYSGTAVTRVYDAENKMTSETTYNSVVAGSYNYDANGHRVKRVVGGVETWQVYGLGGELLAEYAAHGAASSPQKEYGYRNGQLLVTATVTTGWGSPPTLADNPLKDPLNPESFKIKGIHITQLRDAINAVRAHYSLPNYQWQKPAASGGAINNTVSISWEPIDEMRTALDEALDPPSPPYTGGLAQGQPILAVHIQELRDRVLNAWQSDSGEVDIRWLVADQLGTPRMIFDQTGSLANVSRHDYLPFGEELFAGTGGRTAGLGYTSGDSVRQKFTKKERDNETGIDYFLARYYSSTQGRFSSADAPFADQIASDPQSWNLFSYVRNNPLRFVDPTGNAHWDENGNYVGDKDGEYDKELNARWIADASLEIGGYWEFGGNQSPVLIFPPAGMVLVEGSYLEGQENGARWVSRAYLERTKNWRVDMYYGAMGTVGGVKIPGASSGGWLSRLLTRLLGKGGGRVATGVPQLAGATGKEMMHDALRIIRSSGGTAAEKAALFEEFTAQIASRTGGQWQAIRVVGTDGSTIFVGQQGEVLVMNSAGEVFRGSIQSGGVQANTGGYLTPIFSALRKVE